MKSLLFSTFIFNLNFLVLNAQDPALTANDWVLQDLVITGNSNVPSNVTYISNDVILRFTDTGSDYNFQTAVCANSEDIVGDLSYPTTTGVGTMTLNSGAVNAGICCDTNPNGPQTTDQDCVDLINYSSQYSNFWLWNNTPVDFDYEIGYIANSVSLRVTNINGDYALYSNSVTSNNDTTTFLNISIQKNPVKNALFLQGSNLEEIDNISIYNLEGKKVLIMDYYNGESIDVSSLTSGFYFISVNANQVYEVLKFVKK